MGSGGEGGKDRRTLSSRTVSAVVRVTKKSTLVRRLISKSIKPTYRRSGGERRRIISGLHSCPLLGPPLLAVGMC